MKYGMVVKEKEFFTGLTMQNIQELYGKLDGTEAYPVEIEAKNHECSAMGFITPATAESLDYAYVYKDSGLCLFIADVLDDMEKESDTHEYMYEGVSIWLSR